MPGKVKLKPTYKFMQYIMQSLGIQGYWQVPRKAGCAGQSYGGLGWAVGYAGQGYLEGPLISGMMLLFSAGYFLVDQLKMCSVNSFRHGISVEKQFGYSFKVQVLAVIYLNTQLKVHVDLVHIIFPQTEFSNTFHKYRSIKHSSKQSNKVAHKIYSI